MSIHSESPILLIGYRGTGKSTVAVELAARLNRQCADADLLIEEQAGKTIAAIFAEEGESRFRELESAVLLELVKRINSVVALGGGAVLSDVNRRAIRKSPVVVWLTAKADTLANRIAIDRTTAQRRPSLTNLGDREEIEKLLAERTPYYRECATLIVDTEGKSPAEVADEIVSMLH